MKKLSIGKIRGLQQIASPNGIFTMCAMDQRGSLQSMINPQSPASVTPEQMVELKLELCSALGKYATAILIDPIFGAAQCISHNVLPKTTGLLVSIEATGYEGSKEHRITRLLDGWSVEKIKRMGASAVKILLYYRPDLKELARQQLDIISEVAADCQKYDIPFLVEPVSYPIGKEVGHANEFAEIKSKVVVQTARDMTSLPIDVLKAEFPADLNYNTNELKLVQFCEELNDASQKPWVILSAGVGFKPFLKEVELACRCGASGFLAGRAVWQEAITITDSEARQKFLATIAAERLKTLAEVAHKYATPWNKKLRLEPTKLAEITPEWHTAYSENI